MKSNQREAVLLWELSLLLKQSVFSRIFLLIFTKNTLHAPDSYGIVVKLTKNTSADFMDGARNLVSRKAREAGGSKNQMEVVT